MRSRSTFSCDSSADQSKFKKTMDHFRGNFEFVKPGLCKHISVVMDMLDFSKNFEQFSFDYYESVEDSSLSAW